MSIVNEANEFFKTAFSRLKETDDEKDQNKEVDVAPKAGDRTDPPPSLKRSTPAKDDDAQVSGDGDEQFVGDKSKDKKDKESGKRSQEQVNYVKISPDPDKRCENCNHFASPKSCQSVDGDIDADGLCDIWAKKSEEDDK